MSLSETRCYARCTATRRCKDCEELFQATIASVALTTKAKNAKKQQRSRPASKPRPEKVAAKAPREKKKIDEKKLHRSLHLQPGVKILDIVGNNTPSSSRDSSHLRDGGIGIRFDNGYTGWLYGNQYEKPGKLTVKVSYRYLIGAKVKSLRGSPKESRSVVRWIEFDPDYAEFSPGTSLICLKTDPDNERSLTNWPVVNLPDGTKNYINPVLPREEPDGGEQLFRPLTESKFTLDKEEEDATVWEEHPNPLWEKQPSLMAPPFSAFLNSSSVPAKESAPHPLPTVSETTVQVKEPIVPAPLPALPLPPQQPVPVPVAVPLPLPPPPPYPPVEVAAPAKRPPSPTFDKPSPIERAIRIKRIRSEIEKSNTDIKAMLEQEKSWKDQREAHVKETKRLSKLLLEIRKSADGEFYKRQRNLLRLETVDTATWAWSDSYGDD